MDRVKLTKAINSAFKSYFGSARPDVDPEVFTQFVMDAYRQDIDHELTNLVDGHDFGAWADRAAAFAELSPRVSGAQHDRLRQLIDDAARRWDASLEHRAV